MKIVLSDFVSDFLVQEQFLSPVSSRVAPWALYCTLAIPSRCLLSPEVSRGTKCSGGVSKDLSMNINDSGGSP